MIIDCAVYEDGKRRGGEVELDHAAELGRAHGGFTWIGLYEPTAEEFDAVRLEFDLHELAVEDAVSAHQRPKLEQYGDSLFAVIKTARYVDPNEIVEIGEIQLFVGESFVVHVRHGKACALGEVRQGLEERPELLKLGPGAVLHAVVDHVVDQYDDVVLGVENDIQQVEESVFSEERHGNPAERIYRLKREVLEFQRAVHPLIPVLDKLARGAVPQIGAELQPYFRDVEDHALRTRGSTEAFREILTSALEANLAQVTVRQNEDVRRISAWVAILAVPTMIAGVYGMNFDHMPELATTWGYPAVLVLMLVICGNLWRGFRRAGWL